MTLKTLPVSATVAVLVGLAQAYFLLLCWAYIGAYSPLPRWLIGLGLHGPSLRAVVLVIDFLTSVILCIPAALVLLRLRPAKIWLYLALAVVPSFVWLNYHLVGTSNLGGFVLGWLPELLALPGAAWLLHFLGISGASNNSFKPKPLRGSA
ncbi:hypothetical protein [Lysobacter sp. P5_B9]